jgi:hypothetical protein
MKIKNRWSAPDRQAFADRDRLRATAVPGRRHPGPSVGEWDYEDEAPEQEDR